MNGITYTANILSNATTVTISAAGLQGLTNGQSYTMIANVSDAAGNAATPVTSSSFAVDTTAPSPPTVSFPSGTTNNATVTVTLASGATSWEYSTNSGSSWSVGSGQYFVLSEGTYAINAVQVRNSDAAGNNSTTTNNTSSITIDTTAPYHLPYHFLLEQL